MNIFLMLITRSIKAYKFFIRTIIWKDLYRAPKWFWFTHLPGLLKSTLQHIYKRCPADVAWNKTVVYDGMTYNDFRVGSCIALLGKLNIIKRKAWAEDPERAYWIGSLEDE